MRLNKFLTLLICITLFSLVYVYQQSEIFRLAYVGQKRINTYQELLDKNTILRYNITKNASLVRIGNKVAQNSDFQMPDTFRLVKLEQPLRGLKVDQIFPKKQTLLAKVFGIKREAEARTIGPSLSHISYGLTH